jgi:palmitoyltransferase ZDHHC9/14/18
MASRDAAGNNPQSSDMDNTFPNPVADDRADTESILSSRMTDIASDDGGEHGMVAAGRGGRIGQRGGATGDGISRPNTAKTGVSSHRGAWGQSPPSRRGFAAGNTMQRGSTVGSLAGSTTTETTATRPQSSSRTHVPSLTSHAFFRPMNAQRLQAQRGVKPVIPQSSDDGSMEGESSVARNSVTSNPRVRSTAYEDGPPPPSRGTEMTEQETMERVTANTSPTRGHHTTGSLSESVRPLQRPSNSKGLSLNIDKSYKNGLGATLPTPTKSPRSFRSSFLLPTRGDGQSNRPDRNTQGREKLASVASSPGMPPEPQKPVPTPAKLGGNYQYFTGNTVFFWGGRLQNSRDKPVNIATGILTILPAILFFATSATWLWHNISPAIPIVYAYVFYICISSFIHASVSDPGVSTVLVSFELD